MAPPAQVAVQVVVVARTPLRSLNCRHGVETTTSDSNPRVECPGLGQCFKHAGTHQGRKPQLSL
eukprot:2559977-Heterocapsa_arctica.AAC.1